MESHDDPIHNKYKDKKLIKKRNNEGAQSYPSNEGLTYDIDRLNLGTA